MLRISHAVVALSALVVLVGVAGCDTSAGDEFDLGKLSISSIEIGDGTSYDTSYDNNDDGVLNPGEEVFLQVYVEYSGDLESNGDFTGTISLDTAGPTLTGAAVEGRVSSYQTEVCVSCGSYYESDEAVLTVPKSMAPGTELAFSLTLETVTGSSRVIPFTVTVEQSGSALSYVNAVVLDSASYALGFANNADGLLNPGEKAMLQVFVVNSGTSDINGKIQGSLFSDDPYVTVTDASVAVTGIDKEEEVAFTTDDGDTNYPVVELAADSPPNRLVPFTLNLMDALGNPYEVSFDLKVHQAGADLTIQSVEIRDDQTYALDIDANDADDALDPGEKAYVVVTLENIGTSDFNGDLTGTLATTSSYVTELEGAEVELNGVDMGGTNYLMATAGNYPIVRIDAATPSGTSIPFTLDLMDQLGQAWPLEFSVTVD